jgi:hypothetical protein
VVDYAVAKMEEALSEQYAGLDAELARMRQRKQELDLELKRLTDSIAQGQQSQSIMKAIGDREKELRVITDKLLEPAPGSLRAKLEELREFAVSRLSKIRELLARPENIQEAHERICYMRTGDYLASLFAVLAAITQRVMANPARAIPAT